MKLNTRTTSVQCSVLDVGCWMFLLFACSASAQIQQAWVKRYSPNPAATNQATSIALAPDGSVIVAGTSASTNGDLDYVAIKYAPNGQQLWLARYDSPTNGADLLRGMALDSSGCVLLTGTSKTVKLSGNGGVLWSAPYGGRAVAVGTNGNLYVTGFSDLDFATVKLDSNGTNLWLRTFTDIGYTNVPDVSQAVAVGVGGIVAVAGYETRVFDRGMIYRDARVISYDDSGNQLWTTNYGPTIATQAEVTSVLVGGNGWVFCTANFPGLLVFSTKAFDQFGAAVWTWYLPGVDDGARAMALDSNGNLDLTGSKIVGGADYRVETLQLSPSGSNVWLSQYQGPAQARHEGTAIILDAAGSAYVTGYSPGNGNSNDIVTLKYDVNGSQQWVQRYSGPANGNDVGTGIVVDSQGAVYVCGYSATTNGGTEFVTIKYDQLQNIQKKSDGSIRLQYFGTPSQNFAFQASTNLKNWDELGSSMAGTNGIAQFIDTNAPMFSWRFYRYYLP